MTTSKNNFKNVSLQSLVDNPDCSEDDVAQWVRDNSDKFEDDSHPGELSQDKVNKLFGERLMPLAQQETGQETGDGSVSPGERLSE